MAFLGAMAGTMVLGALFGGEENTTVLTQKIRNGLTTDLANATKNVNDVILKNMIDITNEVISKVKANIQQQAISSNIVSVRDIKMSGNAKFTVDQTTDLKWQAQASQQIVIDANVKNDLQAQITNAVLNSTINQNDIMAKLNAVNDLLNRKTDEGGEHSLVSMVDSITSIFKAGKISNDTEVNQEIDNQLNIIIKNTTINENKVQNIIESKVRNIIENITDTSCNQLMTTTNQFYARDIIMSDNAEYDVGQKSILDSVSLCIQTATTSVDLANAIIQSNDNFIKNTTDNKNKVDATMDVKNLIKNIDEKTSVINGLWRMIIMVAAIFGVVTLIVGIIYVAKGGKLPGLSKIESNSPTTLQFENSSGPFPYGTNNNSTV